MAIELIEIKMDKRVDNCPCKLRAQFVLQRNASWPSESEESLEPSDDAVYKIIVTNESEYYAKDVKAITWLTTDPAVNVPNNLRIIPHGLQSYWIPVLQPELNDSLADLLEEVKDGNDLESVYKDFESRDIPTPPFRVDIFKYQCNLVRWGDIPPGQSKVACLAIISEGAPENTAYTINMNFMFECCKLVEVPIPVCDQRELGWIEGRIGQD